jgi:hypothetical protein
MSDYAYCTAVRRGEAYSNAARQLRTAPHDGLLICCTYVPAELAARLLRRLGWDCVRGHRAETPVVVHVPTGQAEIVDGRYRGKTREEE